MEINRTLAQIKPSTLQELPFAKIDKKAVKILEKLYDSRGVKQSQFSSCQDKFCRLVFRKFKLGKLSRNLQNWHTLTYTEFIKELKNKKIKLGLSEEAEWEEYFETEKAKAQEIQAVIDKTDKEIDQMVYELYGLTEEEIAIIENS